MTPRAAGEVPTILLEEHHEAFIAWTYARQRSWIPSHAHCTLLHVDSHDDMMAPLLRDALPVDADPERMVEFVYREMDIASFIWPAVYRQLVNRVVFLHHSHPAASIGWRRLSIRSRNDSDREFIISPAPSDRFHSAPAGSHYVDYAKIVPSMSIDTDQPIILDIDLDYFLSNELPQPAAPEVETTKDVYALFQSDPYQLLRLIPRIKVSAIQHDNRFYLRFFDCSPANRQQDGEESLIAMRMSRLVAFLEENQVCPSLICICRSKFSGYTPARWLERIQSLLLSELRRLYAVDLIPISHLLETIRCEAGMKSLGAGVGSCGG